MYEKNEAGFYKKNLMISLFKKKNCKNLWHKMCDLIKNIEFIFLFF